jgi:enediyne biosynthesis protein E4
MEKIMKHQLILACRALLQGLLLLLCFADLQAQPRFTDATEAAGINHQFVVYEGMFGGGACVFDFNNDGYEDLYLTSGMNDDQLLLNQKDGTFKNIFEGSGLELTKQYVTQGVAGADVNRDGWVDLFITTINKKDNSTNIPRAENLLFLNNGNPTGAGNTFRDATKEYGLEKLYSFSTGGSFGDFNADGYPDLYVGNYFLEYDGPLTEINDATIVNASKTAEGYLLLNKAGKKYKNVYEDYGLNHRGFGFGGLFTDYDNDGDQDLYIINDFGYKAKPNYLLRNNYPKNPSLMWRKKRAWICASMPWLPLWAIMTTMASSIILSPISSSTDSW